MSTRVPESFFATPDLPASGPGRLVLISYHFPPSLAAGALRWQKFARFAAARGWGLDILTLDPRCLPRADASQLQELPDGIRVFGVEERELPLRRIERRLWRAIRPRRSASASALADPTPPGDRGRPSSLHRDELRFLPSSARSWIRAYESWMWFSHFGAWARRAVQLGTLLFDSEVHRAIVSCGPPHMAHEAGRRLSCATGLPLVVDFRDPWSLVERIPEDHASPLWLRLAARYEARCLRRAALVVMNTELASRATQERYPAWAGRIIAVMNGYDDEAPADVPKDSRFLLAYAGSIYLDRSPRTLFRAVANVVRERKLRPSDLAIELMGHVHGIDGLSIESMAAQEGIAGFVNVHPPGTRREAGELLSRATMLVNLPQDSHLCIPSKVFDYMRYDAWLIALAEHDSATELLLREAEADVVAPDDVEGLTAILNERYSEHAQGRDADRITPDERFSRRAQAERLFDAIERIV